MIRCTKYEIIYCDLDQIFQEADIVSIHMSLTSRNKGLICERLIRNIETAGEPNG